MIKNVQFLPESEVPLPVGFTFGEEKLNAFVCKRGFVGQREARLMI